MIATYIMDCFKCHKIIVFSWGFHAPKVIENGLEFKVNGFIHKGIVRVVYNDGLDLFDVFLIEKGMTKKQISPLQISELISVLDRHIEKDESDENYRLRVENEYSLL